MNREEQEKLIVSTLLHYEIYKAGINGEKELDKFIEVLGVKEVKYLYCDDKIKLTSQQLDYICSYGKEKKEKKLFKRR